MNIILLFVDLFIEHAIICFRSTTHW